MKRFAFVAVMLAAALLAACAPAPRASPTDPRIIDSLWTMNDASFGIPEGVKPTLEFRADRLSAHSGCNRANGPYKDLGGKLEAGLLAVTRMACSNPLNEFESNYYRLLSATPAYRIEGDTLTLSAGSDRVRFKRVADVMPK